MPVFIAYFLYAVFRSEQQFIAQFSVHIQSCALLCYRQFKFSVAAHSVQQRFHRYTDGTLRRNEFQDLYSLFQQFIQYLRRTRSER